MVTLLLLVSTGFLGLGMSLLAYMHKKFIEHQSKMNKLFIESLKETENIAEDLRLQLESVQQQITALQHQNEEQAQDITRINRVTFKNNLMLEHRSVVEGFLPELQKTMENLVQQVDKLENKITQNEKIGTNTNI